MKVESTTWRCPGCAWTPEVYESHLSFVDNERRKCGFDGRFFHRRRYSRAEPVGKLVRLASAAADVRIQNLRWGKIVAKDICFRAGGSWLFVATRAEG